MDQEIPNIENKSKILNFWTKKKKNNIWNIFCNCINNINYFFNIKEKDNDLVSEKFLLAGIEYLKMKIKLMLFMKRLSQVKTNFTQY